MVSGHMTQWNDAGDDLCSSREHLLSRRTRTAVSVVDDEAREKNAWGWFERTNQSVIHPIQRRALRKRLRPC